MYETDKKGTVLLDKKTGEPQRKTSHTLNPVPFIIYDPSLKGSYRMKTLAQPPGLANVASTLLYFLGYDPPADYYPSLVEPA